MGLAALGADSAEAARPGIQVQQRSLRLLMIAGASHGYEMGVETDGHRQVTVSLSKGTVSASYTTAGRVSRKGIEADFGELGEISVRFHGKPLPSPRRHVRGCRGRPTQRAFGSFTGTIRFVGENRFAVVNASRARGILLRRYRVVCRPPEPPRPKPHRHRPDRRGQDGEQESLFGGLTMNVLTVGGETDSRSLFMQAISLELGSKRKSDRVGTLLVGATVEHRAGVRIVRTVLTIADRGEGLTVDSRDKQSTTVGVHFPKPLEGSAKLVQEQGMPSRWTGSLLMRLPGAGAVPLTGERNLRRLLPAPVPGTGRHAVHAARSEAAARELALRPSAAGRAASGKRLPLPGFGRRQALLVEVVAELGQLLRLHRVAVLGAGEGS